MWREISWANNHTVSQLDCKLTQSFSINSLYVVFSVLVILTNILVIFALRRCKRLPPQIKLFSYCLFTSDILVSVTVASYTICILFETGCTYTLSCQLFHVILGRISSIAGKYFNHIFDIFFVYLFYTLMSRFIFVWTSSGQYHIPVNHEHIENNAYNFIFILKCHILQNTSDWRDEKQIWSTN